MEHEIIGHTKKALKSMRDHEKSFWEKTKEILIEVLIIVFAVSFAAFIERTREHAKEQSDAKAFLIGLRGDLKNEISEIRKSKITMLKIEKSYSGFEKLKKKGIDSIETRKK